jgi:endonuclease/exonuclease/phosphatase (EEP) superfamily protein YafD
MKESFLDAWEAAGAGDGFTYSSTDPKSRIDYIWLHPANHWRVLKAQVLSSEASDHLPVLVELWLGK